MKQENSEIGKKVLTDGLDPDLANCKYKMQKRLEITPREIIFTQNIFYHISL